MARLFDLPSELLFQIIHLALSAPHPFLPHGQRHRPTESFTGRNVICFPSPGILGAPDVLDLLLTSQRMYSETALYLSKTPQSVKLDVAIVNAHWIWPTLRTIPRRGNNNIVDVVEIEFILCCNQDERHLQMEFGIRMLCEITRELVSLLRHFVFEKPLVTHINTLKINIDTIKYGNGNEVFSNEEVPFRRIEGLAHLNFDALYPIHNLSSIALHRHLCMEFGQLVLEENHPHRISKALFCVDGKVVDTLLTPAALEI